MSEFIFFDGGYRRHPDTCPEKTEELLRSEQLTEWPYKAFTFDEQYTWWRWELWSRRHEFSDSKLIDFARRSEKECLFEYRKDFFPDCEKLLIENAGPRRWDLYRILWPEMTVEMLASEPTLLLWPSCP